MKMQMRMMSMQRRSELAERAQTSMTSTLRASSWWKQVAGQQIDNRPRLHHLLTSATSCRLPCLCLVS